MEYDLHELIRNRYSPRNFDVKSVPENILRSVLEAARWAPSSFNEQPWRFLIATKDDEGEYERMFDCLKPGNQKWAKSAPVLMLSVASARFARNDKPNRHAFHDTGLAVSQLVLQATAHGLTAHQMAGFDADKARATYGIPDDFDPVAAIALGYPAEEMPDERNRRPQKEFVFSGEWRTPYR